MEQTPWIAIARTGTFVDSRGREQIITQKKLEKIAQNYVGRTEDAPVVLGHPEDNQPALGWISAIKAQGEKLFVQFSQLRDAAKEAVRQQAYKYVSMSLFPDGERLRHVGLLGAVSPAITGLGALPVDLNSEEGILINFAQGDLGEGKEHMDQKQMDALIKENQDLKVSLAAAEANIAAAQKATDAVTADFSAYRGEREKADRKNRVDKLVSSGRVIPADRADVLAQAEALAMIPQAMEFSDGTKENPEERFWKSLEARKPSELDQELMPSADFSAGSEPAAMPDLSHKI